MAIAVPAAAPVAAPMTVDLVSLPRICPITAPAIAPPMTFFASSFFVDSRCVSVATLVIDASIG
jgi:hypothetical protein